MKTRGRGFYGTALWLAGLGPAACVQEHDCTATLTCPEPADPSSSPGGAPTPAAEASDVRRAADPADAPSVEVPTFIVVTPKHDAGRADADLEVDSGGPLVDSGGVAASLACADVGAPVCAGALPVCDPVLGQCVACLIEDGTGCTELLPYCVGSNNAESVCVECVDASDCHDAKPVCSEAGACVACASNDDCVAPTALCHEDGQCVECLSADDCDSERPVCDVFGRCQGCRNGSDCGAWSGTPACELETGNCVECQLDSDCSDPSAPRCENNECVGCLDAFDCEGHSGFPLCSAETGACVQCETSSDCPDTSAAACKDHACVPCTRDEECGHFPSPKVCDVAAGQCVQCTPLKEANCGTASCDPAKRTCTTTVRGTRATCEPCAADSECVGGDQIEPLARCVPMQYGGEERTSGYCLRREAAGCQSRVFVFPLEAPSLSGAAAETYCGIAEQEVTCEAVLDLIRAAACPSGEDSECGCARDGDGDCISSGHGGVCRGVGADTSNRCSYRCDLPEECPNGTVCDTVQPWCH